MFRSTFIGILLDGKTSILNNWLWSLLSAGIQVRTSETCRATFSSSANCPRQLCGL